MHQSTGILFVLVFHRISSSNERVTGAMHLLIDQELAQRLKGCPKIRKLSSNYLHKKYLRTQKIMVSRLFDLLNK